MTSPKLQCTSPYAHKEHVIRMFVLSENEDLYNFTLNYDLTNRKPLFHGTHVAPAKAKCNRQTDYKNLPHLSTGKGESTRVSKICSPRRGLPSCGCCKSLTQGLISLSLYKVMVDYFSPTTLIHDSRD